MVLMDNVMWREERLNAPADFMKAPDGGNVNKLQCVI